MQFMLIDKEGEEIVSQTFDTFEPNVRLPADTFDPPAAEGLEVIEVEGNNPAAIMAALQPRPKQVTLEEAKQQAGFEVIVPEVLGEPEKVELKSIAAGQELVSLTAKGKKVVLHETTSAAAVPFETVRTVPGVRVERVGEQEIAVGGSLPNAQPGESHATWQSEGVDCTLTSTEASEEELVGLVEEYGSSVGGMMRAE